MSLRPQTEACILGDIFLIAYLGQLLGEVVKYFLIHSNCLPLHTTLVYILFMHLTGIQLVADISAMPPHHFLFLCCHILATFWRKIKVDSVLESEESRVSIYSSGRTATTDLLGFRRPWVQTPSATFVFFLLVLCWCKRSMSFFEPRPKLLY